MPTVFSRDDHLAQWNLRQAVDSFTAPCPLYTGHLLKLGSNDRWQSRLFTFDGAVLTCVGKRPKASPIATYNPHISSPFQSETSIRHHQHYIPNKKWSLNLTSITDISLQSFSKSYRCLPYGDPTHSLHIRTADGKTLTLRAKKEQELDRWYFILSKIWSIQQLHKPLQQQLPLQQQALPQQQEQQQQQPPQQPSTHYPSAKDLGDQQQRHRHVSLNTNGSPFNLTAMQDPVFGASLLSAHQQSVHLFNKYLQRQQQEQQQQRQHQYQQHQLLKQDPEEILSDLFPSPQQQHRQQFCDISSPQDHIQQSLLPSSETGESFIPYKFPNSKASAFFSHGIGWTLEQGHCLDIEGQNDDDVRGEDQGDDDDDDGEEEETRVFLKSSHPQVTPSASSSMPLIQSDWSVFQNLEPAKAAAIDMWRRGLKTPIMRKKSRSLHSDDDLDEDSVVTRATKIKVLVGGGSGESGNGKERGGRRTNGDVASVGSKGAFGYSHPGTQSGNTDDGEQGQATSWWPVVTAKERYIRPRIASDRKATSQFHGSRALTSYPHIQYRGLDSAKHSDDDNMPLAMVHGHSHHRHISLGVEAPGAAIGLGIRQPHYPPQPRWQQQERPHTYENHSDLKEDDVSESEPLHAIQLPRWQKTQLSSRDGTSTNRSSFAALTTVETPDLGRGAASTLPSRDSYLSLNNRYRATAYPATLAGQTTTSSRQSNLQRVDNSTSTNIPETPSHVGPDATSARTSPTSSLSVYLEEATAALSVDRPGRPSLQSSSTSISNLSLSFNGSSYSHLPIHDPEFAFVGSKIHSASPKSSPRSDAVSPVHSGDKVSSTVTPATPTATVTSTAPEAAAATSAMPETPIRRSPPVPPTRPPRRHPVINRSSRYGAIPPPPPLTPLPRTLRTTRLGYETQKETSTDRQVSDDASDLSWSLSLHPTLPLTPPSSQEKQQPGTRVTTKTPDSPTSDIINLTGKNIDPFQLREHALDAIHTDKQPSALISADAPDILLSPVSMDDHNSARAMLIPSKLAGIGAFVVSTQDNLSLDTVLKVEDGTALQQQHLQLNMDDDMESEMSEESFCYF